MQKLLPESSPHPPRLQAHRNLSVEAKISALGRKINKATRTAQCASFASTAGTAPGLLWLDGWLAGWLAATIASDGCLVWLWLMAFVSPGRLHPSATGCRRGLQIVPRRADCRFAIRCSMRVKLLLLKTDDQMNTYLV